MTSRSAGRPAPLAAGSRDAFATVAEAAAPRLYRVALRMCGRPDAAEDLVQDTLLQALRKWDQFEGRAQPTTWLYTIAARLCRRRHRRRAGEPARLEPMSDLLPSPADPVLAGAGSEGDPLSAHARREAERVVGDALRELPGDYRLPLVLSDIAELTTTEIARILGLKEATVKTRVHRARLRLRRALLEGLPVRQAPPATHDREVCLDLLRAKQEALDRHAPFVFSGEELCARCRSLFATLDLGRDACVSVGTGRLPDSIQALIASAAPARHREPARDGRRNHARK